MTTLPAATALELQTPMTAVHTVPVPVIMVLPLTAMDPVTIAIPQAHTIMTPALTIMSPVPMTMDPVLTTVEEEVVVVEHQVVVEVDHHADPHVDLPVAVQVADLAAVHPTKLFKSSYTYR